MKTKLLIRGLVAAVVVVLVGSLPLVCLGEEGGRGDGPGKFGHDHRRGFEDGAEDSPGRGRHGGAGEPGAFAGSEEKNELTQERMREAVEILKEQNPELGKRVEEAMEKNPERVRKMMRAHWPRLGRMLELRERDPELFKLTMQDVGMIRKTMGLARKAGKAREAGDEAGADAMTAELRDLVARQFDLRQQMRERELENLRKKTEELRAQVEGRLEKKDELIKKRVDHLLSIGGKKYRGE